MFSLVCAVLVFLLIRESPEKLSLSAYGAEDGCAPAEPGAQPDTPLTPLPRRRLLPLWLAAGLLGAVASPGPTHLMILYTTAGMAAHAAALAVSLFGVALMVGKCVYGTACDRFGGYRMGWLFGAILCGGLVLCALADTKIAVIMFAAVVLYGLGVPLSTVGLAVWAADFGGEARVAQLVQQLQLSYAIGSLLLSTMPGMIADRTGSYAPAYLVLLACSVVSILAVQRTLSGPCQVLIGLSFDSPPYHVGADAPHRPVPRILSQLSPCASEPPPRWGGGSLLFIFSARILRPMPQTSASPVRAAPAARSRPAAHSQGRKIPRPARAAGHIPSPACTPALRRLEKQVKCAVRPHTLIAQLRQRPIEVVPVRLVDRQIRRLPRRTPPPPADTSTRR